MVEWHGSWLLLFGSGTHETLESHSLRSYSMYQFPKYFLLGSACLILQLASLAGMTKLSPPTMKQSRVALTLALAMTLLNQFVLEPTATKNMLERYRLEEDGKESSDEYKKLKKSFGKFHGISSLTNLIALCGGVAHAVYLAAALV